MTYSTNPLPADWAERESIRMQSIVTSAMSEHVRRFTTTISAVLSHEEGEHAGTGSYLCLNGKPYLFTNEHVAAVRTKHLVAHQLGGCYVRLANPFQTFGYPLDLAIARIEDEAWTSVHHDSDTVPVTRLAIKHEPVENELLFVVGFSGERSYFSPGFGSLFTPGTPYLTQEVAVPEEWENQATFALHYNSEKATSVDGSTRGLPNAHGFSGSLVWDTKAMRCLREQTEWGPELAEATGIVWGWPTSAVCLLATKIEYVREFLLHALRREAAYFSWQSRGCPQGDDWIDWHRGVKEISHLG